MPVHPARDRCPGATRGRPGTPDHRRGVGAGGKRGVHNAPMLSDGPRASGCSDPRSRTVSTRAQGGGVGLGGREIGSATYPSSDGHRSRARDPRGPLRRGALQRGRATAQVSAELVAEAREDLGTRCGRLRPDVAVVVASERHSVGPTPYGPAFFNDDAGQVRPGVVVTAAGPGRIGVTGARQSVRRRRGATGAASRPTPTGPAASTSNRTSTSWSSSSSATPRRCSAAWGYRPLGSARSSPTSLCPRSSRRHGRSRSIPSRSRPSSARKGRLAAGVRAEGDRTLDELEAHDTGGDAPSSPVNDAWCPYRWLRLAARMVEREGEGVVTRSWKHVRGRGDEDAGAPGLSLVRSLSRVVPPSRAGRRVMARSGGDA